MAFIREVVCEYSELLFLGNKTLHEIKEIEILRVIFAERFGKYKRLYSESEIQLKEIKKFVQTGKELNELELKPIKDYEKIYSDTVFEKERLFIELEKLKLNFDKLNENYVKLQFEYKSFNEIFVKELRNLRFDLNEMSYQRNLLRDNLLEFKVYFGNLNIDDKGEIFIE